MAMMGGPGPQQQAQTTHDAFLGWVILLAFLAVIFFVLWGKIGETVKNSFRWFRWAEIKAISVFVSEDYAVPWAGPDGEVHKIFIHRAVKEIPLYEARDLDASLMNMISTVATAPLKIPFTIFLVSCAFWSLLRGPGTQYRREFNLDGLLNSQARSFPIIAPFTKFNPANQPPRPPGTAVPVELPPFAEALGPEEWIAYNQIPVPDGDLDEQAAYMAFARQLGPRWKGAAHLPAHKQILLAIFCLKASRKREAADDMLGQLAPCWSVEHGLQLQKSKKLLDQARKILRSRNLAGSVLAKANQHAFQTTALIRALATAREEGGVLAPAQFVWLRAYDRILWYPLNNLGRQSFHMEAIGAMSHYKAEKLTSRPIPKPKVDDAVKSISDYMRSDQARPIPQLDYARSKRGGIKKPRKA